MQSELEIATEEVERAQHRLASLEHEKAGLVAQVCDSHYKRSSCTETDAVRVSLPGPLCIQGHQVPIYLCLKQIREKDEVLRRHFFHW